MNGLVPPQCPRCQAQARLTDSRAVHGRSFGLLWLCTNWPQCQRYVGVHKGTTVPLGALADRPTRLARARAHARLDPLWRTGRVDRSTVYRALGDVMGWPTAKAHIAMLDRAECAAVVAQVDAIAARAAALYAQHAPAPPTRSQCRALERWVRELPPGGGPHRPPKDAIARLLLAQRLCIEGPSGLFLTRRGAALRRELLAVEPRATHAPLLLHSR